MDVRATKTAPEREDEEYERLVRPAPKYKPPRRDRRREQVETDRDPDTDGDPDISGDPDRSRNYKDIGGSMVARVLLRFAGGGEVTVRRKEDGKVVQVTEETLRENGSKYEEVSDEDRESDAPKSKPEKGPEQESEPESDDKPDPKADLGHFLLDRAEEYAPFKTELDSLLDPSRFLGGIAEKNPETPIYKVFPKYQFPKGLDTIGDVVEAVNAAKTKRPSKKPQSPAQEVEEKPSKEEEAPSESPKPEKPKEEAPAAEEAPKDAPVDQGPLQEPPVPKETPEEQKTPEEKAQEERFDVRSPTPEIGLDGKPTEEAPHGAVPEEAAGEIPPSAQSPEEATPKAKGKSKSKTGPKEAPKEAPVEAPRREASPAEHEDAVMLVSDTFPPEVAADILSKFSHPDDLERVVANYKAASEHLKVKDAKSFAEEVGEFFQTDPSKVLPPDTWKDASGKEKPFKSLSPEEQGEAIRQHQIDVVGVSLAAKSKLASSLQFTSLFGSPQVPRELATHLADFILHKGDETAADTVGKRLFDAALKGGGLPSEDVSGKTFSVDPKVVKKLFAQIPPEAKKVAGSYFEGLDYRKARDKYLGPGGFSEWDSPRKIFAGLKSASDFFSEQGKLYGQGENHTGKLMFRVGVLHRLRAIDPEKYAEVRKLVAAHDEKHYGKAIEQWKKDHAKWEERKTKFEAGRGPYRAKSFDEPEPVEPKKPAGAIRTKVEGRDLLESVKSRRKTAARARSIFISTCAYPSAMDRDPLNAARTAVRQELARKGRLTAGQRGDQGSRESTARVLVAKAEAWLKVPVLNDEIRDVPREAQLRAALDLAIKQSPQDSPVDSGTYSDLLTQLGGTRISSCLPPRREVIPMSRSARVRKFASRAAKSDPELAYDLIAFADKLASEEKKDQEAPKDDEEKGQQAKEASSDKYTTLRSLVIRTAAADADAKRVLTPILQLLQKQGV